MKEHEYIARQRYRNDPQYYNLVNFLEKFMNETKISPNEIHDAVNLAADVRNMVEYTFRKNARCKRLKADYEQIDQFITREQVLAAKGHELSLLVAKHIMHDHITIISIHNDTGCQDIESCKDYALDIAAAWEIVKKLKDDGLLIIMIDTPKDYYHFRVLKNGNGWRGYKSKTAPEAICKASLLAMLEVEAG